MREVVGGVAAFFGILLLLWLGVMFVFGLRVATAGIVGAGEARIQIQSAPFRIGAYQSFFNKCASIQALEYRLDDAFDQLNTAGTQEDRSRIRTNIAGLQGLHAEAVTRYNTDARKNYTEGQFRDSDLPFQLSTESYTIGGKKTSCGVD